MAERRMFAKTIIDSDAFLEMPLSTQALYFHLSMRADDEGFINNPKKIARMIGAADDDLKVLITKRFIIPFESEIVVIKHWRIHNYIRGDRCKPSVYEEEKSMLTIKDNGAYTVGIPSDNQMATIGIPTDNQMTTQVRLGKDRLGKDSIESKRFTPPTLEELTAYCKEKGYTFSPQNFISYYESNGWMVGRNKMKDWKSACSTWQSRERKQPQKNAPFISHNDDGMDLDELLKRNNVL